MRRQCVHLPARFITSTPAQFRAHCQSWKLGSPEVKMFVLARATTYSALFIGLLLLYVPSRLLSWAGIARPAALGVQHIAGMVIGAAGAAAALWCIFTFVSVGRGTPAPFDPTRRDRTLDSNV
jgi:hypothetical protein